MLIFENLRLKIQGKWESLGKVNQVLVAFAGIFIVSLSVTSYLFARQAYDMRNIKCLAMNVYHEARGEPTKGQYAVAVVTMNRVESDRYPQDVCQVVYQKAWIERSKRFVAAFSWTVDQVEDIPLESAAWKESYQIAQEVYGQAVPSKVQDALFYHADHVKPRWAANKLRIAKIGRHIFYK